MSLSEVLTQARFARYHIGNKSRHGLEHYMITKAEEHERVRRALGDTTPDWFVRLICATNDYISEVYWRNWLESLDTYTQNAAFFDWEALNKGVRGELFHLLNEYIAASPDGESPQASEVMYNLGCLGTSLCRDQIPEFLGWEDVEAVSAVTHFPFNINVQADINNPLGMDNTSFANWIVFHGIYGLLAPNAKQLDDDVPTKQRPNRWSQLEQEWDKVGERILNALVDQGKKANKVRAVSAASA